MWCLILRVRRPQISEMLWYIWWNFSPNERETCTSITPATTPLGAPMKIFLGFLIIQFCFVILIILYIFCIGFCISKHWYKNDITYKRYLRGAFTALPNCIVQIARGETWKAPYRKNAWQVKQFFACEMTHLTIFIH